MYEDRERDERKRGSKGSKGERNKRRGSFNVECEERKKNKRREGEKKATKRN